MKARDVEKRLQGQLPLLTDRFTREQALLSIIPAGTTATATTAAAHDLTVGKKVLIAGANAPVGITSIIRVDDVATAVTDQDHDLTEDYITALFLSGSNESEFNGEFELQSVTNRRTFTFTVPDSGPTSATGSSQLDSPGLPFGYNGTFVIASVPTTTTFTYELPQALTIAATGDDMRMIKGVRIHAAITADRALQVFESKDLNNLPEGELALFVVLGDVAANRDRSALNDGVSSGGVSGDNRQIIFQSITCLVLQKVTKDTSGADAGDDMQDIARFIIGVLAGWSPADIGWAVDSGNKLKFVSHGLLQYNSAIYAHVVEFQFRDDISDEDLEITPNNVAFRDISFQFTNDQGNQILSATVNLDDEPIGG